LDIQVDNLLLILPNRVLGLKNFHFFDILKILTVEDSLQLAAGFFNLQPKVGGERKTNRVSPEGQ
jgi:hypothetical protein